MRDRPCAACGGWEDLVEHVIDTTSSQTSGHVLVCFCKPCLKGLAKSGLLEHVRRGNYPIDEESVGAGT